MFRISVFQTCLFVTIFLTQEVLNKIITASLHRSSNTYAALWSAGVELKTRDVSTCAFSCRQHNSFCDSFSFDVVTSQCTLDWRTWGLGNLPWTNRTTSHHLIRLKFGYCVVPSAISAVSTVKLYQTKQELCESTAGFRVYVVGNVKACLWMSPTKKVFADAAVQCAAMGSTLVTLKSKEKTEIIKLFLNMSIFVGLDDFTTEGTFVWQDDHTVLPSHTIPQLFVPGQPDDYNNDEDCIEFNIGLQLLNDVACWWAHYYVCEKSCFVFE